MMPARNVEQFLEAALENVLRQSYWNWELIFVDDGSTDSTLAIARRYALTDSRIKVFPIVHQGRGVARNECIKQSRGVYVAVFDADDISFIDRIERQVNYLKNNPSIGVISSSWIPFSGTSPLTHGPIRRFASDPAAISRAFGRGKMRVHNATAMLRAELFEIYGGYNKALRRAQDYEFFSRLNLGGVKFAALEEPLVYYRQEAEIPSLRYFRENGMYMAYADRILSGHERSFEEFSHNFMGKFWHYYYSVKYIYFYAKIWCLTENRRNMG